ncbi:MAG: hemerythrin domain-containing protein [bacterium]
MDVYTLLTNDHQRLTQLMDLIDQTPESASHTRGALFQELKTHLYAHTEAEETMFYSAIEHHHPPQGLMPDARADHEAIDEIMAQLVDMDISDLEWSPLFRRMKDQFARHVVTEESQIFHAARNFLAEAEAASIADSLVEQFADYRMPERASSSSVLEPGASSPSAQSSL